RAILLFVAVVILMDAIILSFVGDVMWISLSLLSVAMVFIWKKTKRDTRLKVETGLDLGEGVNIMNPDSPERVHVILEEKALDLGFLAIGGPGSGKSMCSIVLLAYYTMTRKIGWCYSD